MGLFDDVKDAVDEAQDKAEDVADSVGEAVDQAEDTVQEETGVDLGGSGGGSDDSDTETTESSFSSGGSSSSSSSSGSSSSGSSSSGSSSSGSSSSTSSSSSGGGSSGSSSSGGGSSGGTVSRTVESVSPPDPNQDQGMPEDAKQEMEEFFNEQDRNTADKSVVTVEQGEEVPDNAKVIRQELNKFGEPTGPKKVATTEAAASRLTPEGGSSRDGVQIDTINADAPESVQEAQKKLQKQQFELAEAKRNKEQLETQEKFVQNRLKRARSFDEGAELKKGGETITREELIQDLEQKRDQIRSQKQEIQSFQGEASSNIDELEGAVDTRKEIAENPLGIAAPGISGVASQGQGAPDPVLTQEELKNLEESGGRTTKSVEEVAREMDLDNAQVNVDVPFVGQEGEPDATLTGLPARTAASFDTFTSDRGFEQLSTAAPWVDKSGAQVIKENIVESRREQRTDPGFDPGEEAVDTLSSPAGLAFGARAAGALFKGGTAALAAQGGKAATAAKGIEGTAAVAGGVYAASEVDESRRQFQEGENQEATENLLKLGTEFGGFAAGARGASRALSPEVSRLPSGDRVVRGEGTNRLRATEEGGFEGSGQFEGRFNVEAPRISERLGIAESGEGTVRAQFRTFGFESSSQARGRLEVDVPGRDTQSRDFEAVNIRTGTGETPSGQEVTLSRNVLRSESEGPLFRNTETRTGSSRNIRESDQTKEVQEISDGLFRSEEARVVETASRSTEDSGDVRAISETTNIIRDSPSTRGFERGSGVRGTGGSQGGSGAQLQGSSRTRTDFQDGQFDFSDQVARGVSDTVGISAGTSQSGGGAQGATADLADSIFGGQETGSQEQAQASGLFQGEAQSQEVERAPTSEQPVLGSRSETLETIEGGQETVRDADPGFASEEIDTGGPGLEEETRDPLDQSPGIFEDQPQREDRRETAVPREEQVSGLDQDLGQPQRQGVGELQEVGVFQPQRTELETSQIELQREQLQQRQPLRPPTGRGVRRPPAAPPGRPGSPLIGGGGFGESSRSDDATRPEGEFAPSIEGIALGIRADEEDTEGTLTGLEPRGIPSQQEEPDQETNSGNRDNPGILF